MAEQHPFALKAGEPCSGRLLEARSGRSETNELVDSSGSAAFAGNPAENIQFMLEQISV